MRADRTSWQGGIPPCTPHKILMQGIIMNQGKDSKNRSEKRHRQARVTVRLSSDERTALETAANASGLTLGSYIRARLTDGKALRSVRRPPVECDLLARLLGQIGKVGSNLNQIAMVMNAQGIVMHGAISDELSEVKSLREAILKALGRNKR